MRVGFDFGEQLCLFEEDELFLFLVETDLLHALDSVLLVTYLVYYAVARADHLTDLEALV